MPWYDLQLAATFYMVGVIWLVQIVHYPLFSAYDSVNFSKTMLAHQTGTTWVVVPAMLIELVTALVICVQSGSNSFYWIATSLLVLIWLVTFGISVPLHAKLAKEKDIDRVRKLVATNWIRTVLWTTRGALLLLARGGG